MRKIIAIFILIIILTGCGKRSGSRKGQMEQQKDTIPTVSTMEIQTSSVDEYVSLTGKVEGINEVTLIAETNGKIIKTHKHLGDSVKAGESIAEIDHEEINIQLEQAQSNALAFEALLESEAMKYRSAQKLYKKNSISETEFILSESSYKSAQANYNGAVANVKLMQKNIEKATFRASISGKIANLPVSNGDYVSIGSQICKIVDDTQMIIRTGTGQKTIKQISKNDPAIIFSKNDDQVVLGKVEAVGYGVSSDGFNYPLEIIFDNHEHLISGELVNIKIRINSYTDVIKLKPSSVKSFYDDKFVYIVNNENVIEKRKIDILDEISGVSIVSNGLQIGDQIVIEGFELIQEGTKVNPKLLNFDSVIKQTTSELIGG